MKTIRCISLWAVLSIVMAGLTLAADAPLLITNKDLPKTLKVSVLGTLRVVEATPDTAWIDRIDAMIREAEAGRQTAPDYPSEWGRSDRRGFCSVGSPGFIAVVGVGNACLNGVCPEDRPPLKPRPFFGVKHSRPDDDEPVSPHLVDAIPAPRGGFAGRLDKHLGEATGPQLEEPGSQQLVDALPEPKDGFVGRPGKHLGLASGPPSGPARSPHLVDALPTPAGGFAGRPGKHLGRIN